MLFKQSILYVILNKCYVCFVLCMLFKLYVTYVIFLHAILLRIPYCFLCYTGM